MAVPHTIEHLKISIIARSTSGASSTFVVARMSAPSGKSVERTFDLKRLSDDARPLHKIAAELGIAVLRPASKVALIEKFEKAVAVANADDGLLTFSPALQPGWHRDAFVTPQKIYGADERLIKAAFSDPPPALSYFSRGSIGDWKQTVGSMIRGNPLLIFITCAALMPPLMRLLEWDQGCGFALIGKTRGGKTTGSILGGSICGGGDEVHAQLVHTLRVAKNGLEPAAPFANDRAFFLDDAQNLPDDDKLKAQVLRNTIYMLHQGRGKERMGFDSPPSWLTVFFICHNQTLRETMIDGRQKHNKAAEARLIEILCDRKYVVFDDIHEEKSASDFADALRRRANRFNGTPFHVLLTELTRQVAKDKNSTVRWLRDRIDSMRRSHLNLSDADYSVGKYFCLAYAAGRFAEEYCDFLPVSADEIRNAIIDIYQRHRMHLAAQSTGSDPVTSIRRYIDQKYTSLLDQRKGKSNAVQGEPVGYITNQRERKEYSFTKEQFAAAVAPYSIYRACDALKAVGLLVHDGTGTSSSERNVTKRNVSSARLWVYCISDRIFEAVSHPTKA